MKKIKVLYLTNLPSPYMISYFNLLGQSVDLTVVFEQKSSNLQRTRWNNFEFNHFTGYLLNGMSLKKYGALSINIIKYININYDFIFVTNPLTPSGIISIIYMKIRKINYIIESEGGFPGSGKGVKELFKKFVLSKAYYYFSGNDTGDDYFFLYGATKNKIIRYPFSSVYESNIIKNLISSDQKKVNRLEHNLQGERTAVGIGRLVKSKNWEWLINEWKSIKSQYHLYIIGEGPLKDHLINIITSSETKNIHLLDYIEHKKLLEFIDYFDILVHPTLSDVWGLTINEGMARGLPVVSSPNCLASLEMIEDGLNGFICETNSSFLKRVEYLLDNNNRLSNTISNNNINKVKYYTINQMVKVHTLFMQDHKNSINTD